MSASEDTNLEADLEDIDSLCPHGPDEPERPPLEYIDAADRWSDDAVLCNPDAIATEWIRADEELFVEVVHR